MAGVVETPHAFESHTLRQTKIIRLIMTSRTIDIHCEACRKYLFSIQPNDYKELHKDHYCKAKKCQEQAVVDRLKKQPGKKN